MNFLQVVVPVIVNNTPSGPWTKNDTLIAISVTLAFFVLYVFFALVDKLRGETWADAFHPMEGGFIKALFSWFFWVIIIIYVVAFLAGGIYYYLLK